MKKNQDKKEKYFCSRCGDLSSDVIMSIKTKRGTVLNLCDKCVKEGI